MIEYDVDPQFADAVKAGSKTATIRRMRLKPRRHARLGEPIEIWAMQGKYRTMIRRAECSELQGVFLHLAANVVRVGPITAHRATWAPLKPAQRRRLAEITGHPGGWKEAAAAYAARYGRDPFTGTIVHWRDREYDGPIPSLPQLRDLKILRAKADEPGGAGGIIPSYGKISTGVGITLCVLRWAEVLSPWMKADGHHPIRITDLGRWILDRFAQ